MTTATTFLACLDPCFHAMSQTMLDAYILTLFDWTRLALTCKAAIYSVQHAFAGLSLDHILGFIPTLRKSIEASLLFERYKTLSYTKMSKLYIPKEVLVWHAQGGVRRYQGSLYRILSAYTHGGVSTYCTLLHLHGSWQVNGTDKRETVYLPVLNPGLEVSVARIAIQQAQSHLPKTMSVVLEQ